MESLSKPIDGEQSHPKRTVRSSSISSNIEVGLPRMFEAYILQQLALAPVCGATGFNICSAGVLSHFNCIPF